jgi:hypothetical protein
MLRRLCLLAATPLLLPVAAVAVAAIAWPLLLLVLLVDLLWWPVALLRRRPLPYLPRDVRSASIVTVTWNGRHWLEVLLPSLRAVVQ